MNFTEQLERSAAILKNQRPSYGPILEFYRQVFLAQENSKKDITLPAITVEPDLLKIKMKNEMPLIDPSEFLIDQPAAERLFDQLCDLAIVNAPQLSANALILKTAAANKEIDLQDLFFAILNNHDATLHALSKQLNVPEREIAFMGYASMVPSIQISSQQLTHYLSDRTGPGRGYCPVCGNHPDLAFLDQDGKRFLKCCFCSHQWGIKRMGCVFCENNDASMQHYFFNDEEKEYRVNLCDHCHAYIKVVDLRHIDRTFYPKLEQITTLHLDMTAREQGYTNHGAIANDVSL